MSTGFYTYRLLPVVASVTFVIILSGCSRLNVEDTLEDERYELVEQNGDIVTFPEAYRGKILLVGYVYTHCPDICPVITYNMRDVQRELNEEEDVLLVSISFDPERDTPEVLREYAESYKIDQKNWKFLTGNTSEVESALEKLKIQVIKTPTSFTDDNKPIYFMDHTDKVTLVDRRGQVRETYSGSELNPGKVTQDIRLLLDES